ncbi:hypothetical protein CQW23_21864 [Capsicum baccatum]|uniref:Isoamylase 3, chloroplastic n=1 Tax=Capsicum baccatum TaxID=33114 RepID=A0A2G2VZA5_CAPBA|nr:hypothetical protein CQW23_21864 [Capsicum baccatum]
MKSEKVADMESSEIRSHRNKNFVVPVGFSSGHPSPLGLSFQPDGSLNFALFSHSAKCVVLCLCKAATSGNRGELVLLDPYAKVIRSVISRQGGSEKCPKYLGELCQEPGYDWSSDVRPSLPMEKLIIYRLNVTQFTKDKSSKLPDDLAGTFSGISKKWHHFKDIGVNAMLLEPIFPFEEQKGP